MKKRCRKCGEKKPLAEYLDPVLRGKSLSQVCDDCRHPRIANLMREDDQ